MRSTSALVTAFCTSAAAGVGYYTAILAEVAGPLGHITAIDIDADLAQRARTHLAPWPQVEVVTGDGGQLDTGPCDAIFVNAGATHPRPLWLERLRPRGRLLVPLTVNIDGGPFAGVGWGGMLKIAPRAAPSPRSGFHPVRSS